MKQKNSVNYIVGIYGINISFEIYFNMPLDQ